MMPSLFTAVSGIKSQQTSLDVIANNIANADTTGYKSSSVSFSDLLSQTLSGASSATTTSGGKNAVQVGTGVKVASTNTDMTTGSLESTGVDTDCAISGNGYFIVQDGSSYLFTKDGEFGIDADGNLNVDGHIVCGWSDYTVDTDGNYVFNTQSGVSALNLYDDGKKVMSADATSAAALTGYVKTSASVVSGAALSVASGVTLTTSSGTVSTVSGIASALSATSADMTTTMTLYDEQGNSYDATVSWKKYATDSSTNTTSWYYEVSADGLNISPSSGFVLFNSAGEMITSENNTSGFDLTNFAATPSVAFTPTSNAVNSFTVKLDLSGVKNVTTSDSATVSVKSIDGYSAGTLNDVSVEEDGTITGTYTNGKTQPLGMIAIATFANAEGLTKVGDNMFAQSSNSGTYTAVTAGENGSGALKSGYLEMSNVDLSEEFSKMMISQRAYQANTKVVSTCDSMLQSLINMVG